nr:MAG TPA: hypothetical protein [Caudoviricetes sp.]
MLRFCRIEQSLARLQQPVKLAYLHFNLPLIDIGLLSSKEETEI